MLHSYSFVGAKNGEEYVKTSYTSLSAIAFMMDCLDCNCAGECNSGRFLRELEEFGMAILIEVQGGDLYKSHAWRNEP